MSEPGTRPHPPAVSVQSGPPLLPQPPSVAWAVGMVMAVTPCPARDAGRILRAAADLALTTVEDLAAAMTTATSGVPLPTHWERSLRAAIETARTPAPSAGVRPACLMPSAARTKEVLTRLRGCQARLAASPSDPGAVRALDDAVYTLCVLMGRAVTHEAVLAAEEHLATHQE